MPLGPGAAGAHGARSFPSAELSCWGTALALACQANSSSHPPPRWGQGVDYATGGVMLHTGTCSLGALLFLHFDSHCGQPPWRLRVSRCSHISSLTFRCRNCTPELCSQASHAPKAAPACLSAGREGTRPSLSRQPPRLRGQRRWEQCWPGWWAPGPSAAAAASSSLGGAQIAPRPWGARYNPPGAACHTVGQRNGAQNTLRSITGAFFSRSSTAGASRSEGNS